MGTREAVEANIMMNITAKMKAAVVNRDIM
jgi:hypothetical protein